MSAIVKQKTFIFVLVLFFGILGIVGAQNTRISTHQTIGWYNIFTTLPIQKKWSFHGEFQCRRADGWKEGQQNLVRTGINYHYSENGMIRVGYAYIDTYPYGEIPINGMGKPFSEHRLFEMLQQTIKTQQLSLTHRLILEQRWVGRYSNSLLTKEDQFPLLNRLRYQFRLQKNLFPLKEKGPQIYGALYDEVMIGFGKNVGENIFDQNRLGCLLGYPLNKQIRLEAGFLSQILQLGREVNGSNVFQYNNGWIINLVTDFRQTGK